MGGIIQPAVVSTHRALPVNYTIFGGYTQVKNQRGQYVYIFRNGAVKNQLPGLKRPEVQTLQKLQISTTGDYSQHKDIVLSAEKVLIGFLRKKCARNTSSCM